MTLAEALLASHTQINQWVAETLADTIHGGREVHVAKYPGDEKWMVWWYIPYFQSREEDEGTELCASLAEVQGALTSLGVSPATGWNAVRLPDRARA